MKKYFYILLGALLMVTGVVYAGTTATPTTQGGTGINYNTGVQSGALLYGNGASAVSTTTGTGGQILAWLNGVPTFTATTTYNAPLTYSSGAVSCASCNTNGTNWKIINVALIPTTTLGIIVNASSTVGDGTQAGGLTISGGATTTGNAFFKGTINLNGSILTGGSTASLTIPPVSGTDIVAGTGVSTDVPYWTSAYTISNQSGFTFTNSNLLTSPYASTTGESSSYASSTTAYFGSTLKIPSWGNPEPPLQGSIAQSSNYPYQLQVGTSSSVTAAIFDPRTSFTLGISTTTAWTGTTTAPVVPIPTGLTWSQISCVVQPIGATVEVHYQYNGATTAQADTWFVASSSNGVMAMTSNNTPPTNATTTISFGNPASSPTSASCTLTGTVTGI